MNPLVVIPARGGSKGIPGKNIKKLSGKPLINYTIEAAREVFKDKMICVSTDDKSIKETVEQTGLKVPFLRPSELASDKANTQDVMLHALEYYQVQGYQADTIILLQPTSPFRTEEHIEEALRLYTSDIDMVVSVKETSSNPYFVLFEENEEGFLVNSKKGSFTRRQDCPTIYEYNGAIYVINSQSLQNKKISDFEKIKKYLMDELSSIDIDTYLDWNLASYLNNAQKTKLE